MSREALNIGILFSQTGSYAAVGSAMAAGAMLAIDEVNSDDNASIHLKPVIIDPGGDISAYAEGAETLLRTQRITHVFGCYTSSSRKEILPIFEKNDGLLWYPSHYEGFETSDSVVYTGAAPNQHVIPLAQHLLAHHGNRGWFVGSNYVWAWENNRILREALQDAGGAILGERYFPVGETDLACLVEQILRDRPDFIFTTLIGESGFRFIQLLRDAAIHAGIDQPRDLPIASCSLSEVELPFLEGAAAGHLSSSVYFSTIKSNENDRFTSRWAASYGHLGNAPADAEATYIAVHLLVRAVARAGGQADFNSVREALRGLQFPAPQGLVEVDPVNLHCAMRPRIGRSTDTGTFELLYEAEGPIRPDPYLVWSNEPIRGAGPRPGRLRVIR